MAVETHPLTPDRHADVVRFFGTHGEFGWCWCAFWDVPGDARAWIQRTDAQNRTLREAGLAAGTLAGVLLYVDGEPRGWCRLDRRRPGDKYASWYGDPLPDTVAIGCFAIAAPARGQGNARRLLDAALAHARALGARRVEGYPREAGPERMPDGEAWTGPARLYAGAGFTLTPAADGRIVAALPLGPA